MATTTATKKPPTDTGRCGTYAGHQRHYKRGEENCGPCAQARRTYQNAWQATAAASRKIKPVDRRGAKPLSERSVFGRLAGLPTMHPARLRNGQCVECWGWPDDPRHPVAAGLVA